VFDFVTMGSAQALLALNPNTSYQLSDVAANLLDPANQAIVAAAFSIAVAAPVTVAEAGSLLAINFNTFYDLSDTATNILANLAFANAATSVNATSATVAQADALLFNFPGAFYTLVDTGANLLAAPDPFTLLFADQVIVTQPISVADANTLLGETFILVFDLADTAAVLIAPQNLATLNASNVVTLTDVTAPTLSAVDISLLLAHNAIFNNGYILSDSAANILDPANFAAVAGANAVEVNDISPVLTVAQVQTLVLFDNATFLHGYSVSDTAAHIFAAGAATTIGGASEVTVTDTALTALQGAALVGQAPSAILHYDLTDTAAHLLAASAAVDNRATNITVTDPVSVAQATTIDGFTNSGLNSYSVLDTAANLASGFSTGSPSLAAIDNVNSVDVSDLTGVLTLNADQFGHFLSGPTLLAATDTITVDGAGDVSANLGTLTPFGGDVLAGMHIGGAQNGSYVVNMGTAGESQVFLDGTGHHQVTAAVTKETFFIGAASTGGLTILGLRSADQIDIGAGGTRLDRNGPQASAAAVDVSTEWFYGGGVLTWFDDGHNIVQTTVLQLTTGTTLTLGNNRTTFTVV
jgi:hypothetical protein